MKISKKLKWIIILGLAGFTTVLAGAVVLVVFLVSQFAPLAIQQSKNLVAGASSEIQQGLPQGLDQVNLAGCAAKLQSSMTLESWLGQPLYSKFQGIYSACFGGPSQPAESPEPESSSASELI